MLTSQMSFLGKGVLISNTPFKNLLIIGLDPIFSLSPLDKNTAEIALRAVFTAL